MKIWKLCIAFWAIFCLASAQTHEPPSFYELNEQPNPVPAYVPDNGARYVLGSTAVMFAGSLAVTGIFYFLPSNFTGWARKELSDIAGLGDRWKERVRSGPVVDNDDLFLNWVTHPYWGAVYYMQPRVAGYSWAESVLFSFVASAFFWEYGIESFAEIPRWQDLVITPAIGSIFGELFYRGSLAIEANQRTVLGSRILGEAMLIAMDPLGVAMQRWGLAELLGIHNKQQTTSCIVPNDKGGASLALLVRF